MCSFSKHFVGVKLMLYNDLCGNKEYMLFFRLQNELEHVNKSAYIHRISTRVVTTMTIYNLYVFDRIGQLIHYAEWNRKKDSGIPREEEYKLMYGMLFSMKSFAARLSPVDYQKDGFVHLQTNKYNRSKRYTL